MELKDKILNFYNIECTISNKIFLFFVS